MLRAAFRLYWKIYSLQGGWHREYAKYMRKHALNKKQCRRQITLLQKIYLEKYPEKNRNSFTLKLKTLDFLICRYLFGTHADSEYYYLLYENYGWKLRNRFVTVDRANFACHYLNDQHVGEICLNKVKAAEYWSDWFKRKWYLKEPEKELTAEDLKTIFGPEGKCIVKPLKDYGGHGIFVLDPKKKDFSEKLESLNEAAESHILETYLNQTGVLHTLNESSLNTVRLITARHPDGEIETLGSIMRTGRAGAVVDNVSSGGVSFDVDINTGRVYFGTDYHGYVYTSHPDTGLPIEGMQIPRWREIQEFAYAAHKYAPEGLNFAAWDICLTEEDIYLIEVNHRPAVCARNPDRLAPWERLKILFDEYESVRSGKQRS
ncbi:MAG: hypothetical protein IJJ44_09090 [Solobacterium sp.]|nr:hypothetical protein [Solobacterium sp.]